MTHVSVNVSKPHDKITTDVVVLHKNGSVGIVTNVTKKWVHVTWLISTFGTNDIEPQNTANALCAYHFSGLHKRIDLTPAPKGYALSVKQV